MNRKIRAASLLALVTTLVVLAPLSAQDALHINSSGHLAAGAFFDMNQIFEDEHMIKATIYTNVAKLYDQIEDPKYQKGRLFLFVDDSVHLRKEIELRARGDTRKKICDIPPIKLDFKKSDYQPEWFEINNSWKIVNPCNKGREFEAYMYKEYLIYKLYNQLTDFSYKVRLMELTIKDTKKKKKDERYYSFFIENDKALRTRTSSEEIEIDDTNVTELVTVFYLDPSPVTMENFNLFSVFQYMIGNTDWNTNGMHNVKIFKKGNDYFPVPYDFDYSGFVGAPYAVPAASTPISSVKERYYQGPCADPVQFNTAVGTILKRKDQYLNLVSAFEPLSKGERRAAENYLQSFFSLTMDTKFLTTTSRINCQDMPK